jgi:transposase
VPAHPWVTHDWELQEPTELHARLAEEWLALYQQIKERPGTWTELRGGGQQYDTTKEINRRAEDAKRVTLRSVTEAALRATLQALGVDTASLHLAAMKMLRSQPGGKDQHVHFDISNLEEASTRWSMLLYCNETMSTAMPRKSAQAMAPAFIASHTATADQQLVCEELCNKKNFISMPVKPGNLLAFKSTVAHYGVAAQGSEDRVVVYALFSPDDKAYQDEEQRFPLGAPDSPVASPEPMQPPLKKIRLDTLAAVGLAQRGKSRPPLATALSLLHITDKVKQGLSFDAAIKKTAAVEHTSPHSLRQAVQFFTEKGELLEPSPALRGRGNPTHSLHSSNIDVYGPSLEAELLMHDLVYKQKTDGVCITSATIAAELRAQLGVAVHRSTVRRWLRALGYRWRHKRYVGGMKPQARHIRIRQFVLEYAAALAEEEAGTAIIVYVDESYIHSHHASKKGWLHPNDRDVIGDGDGKRLIILHAMTDSGLLATPDAVATNWLSEPALTAELVFEEVLEDGQDDSDYHNTMTGAKFVAWLRNRLLPTFEELHPGKRMHLVLDNASYHKPRDESWVSRSKAKNKHELAHTLLDLGVTELITVGDSPRIVPAHRFEAAVSAGGPSKEDLLAAVQRWLDEHPDHNRTVVEQLMNDAGHSLIYTPPFCPEVQPIELLWAQIKRCVADRCTHNRSMIEARQQTEEAFEKITKMLCNSVVKHCHDWIDRFIASEAAEDLQQCGTLAGVIKHLSLLKIANNNAAANPSHLLQPAPAPVMAPMPCSTRALRRRL